MADEQIWWYCLLCELHMLAVFVFTKVEFGQKRSYAVREVSREKSGIVRNVKISLSRKKKERERGGEREGRRENVAEDRGRENSRCYFAIIFVYICHSLIAHKSSVIFCRFDAHLETYAKSNQENQNISILQIVANSILTREQWTKK